jgi:sugar lactone lactonase YvrE
VYATDALSGRIVLARETASGTFETRVVASDILLPNGLAYDASTSKLYAVSSGAWDVLSFDVVADGTLGKATPVTVNGFILTMDGVAVDETGTVYIADYFGGAVVRARDGKAIAQLTNPASLAFRGGTLLITDYRVLDQEAEGGLYAVELGICGAPLARRP